MTKFPIVLLVIVLAWMRGASKSGVFLRRVQPIKYCMYYHYFCKEYAKPPFTLPRQSS